MAEPLIRVLVTGSRTLTDRGMVARALTHLGEHFIFGVKPSAIVLVHGGASGADTLAAEEAVRLGWQVQRRTSDWGRETAHYLVAFPGGRDTARCRRLALHARIPVIDIPEGARRG